MPGSCSSSHGAGSQKSIGRSSRIEEVANRLRAPSARMNDFRRFPNGTVDATILTCQFRGSAIIVPLTSVGRSCHGPVQGRRHDEESHVVQQAHEYEIVFGDRHFLPGEPRRRLERDRYRASRVAYRCGAHPAHRRPARAPRDPQSILQYRLLQRADESYPLRARAHWRYRRRTARERLQPR